LLKTGSHCFPLFLGLISSIPQQNNPKILERHPAVNLGIKQIRGQFFFGMNGRPF